MLGSILGALAIGFAFSSLGAVLGVAGLIAVLGEPAPAQALAAFDRAYIAIALTVLACTVVGLSLGRHQPSQLTAPGQGRQTTVLRRKATVRSQASVASGAE